jgi:glycerophosphoryl diester phosphodiesterase
MAARPNIITHRGLDPDIEGFPPESSIEAFENHLQRGYGIEFDIQPSDGKLVVSHNKELQGKKPPTIDEVLALMSRYNDSRISAIHYKGRFQNSQTSDLLLAAISPEIESKLIVFDVTIETAAYIKAKRKGIRLAPSVSHQFDIERYNSVVGETLIPTEKAIASKDLFDWVWLDEWDRTDAEGKRKTLYSKETFDLFRKNSLKIALVTPELHATSPGLLGSESHEDGRDIGSLEKRIAEIVALEPDAICTDHPDMLKRLLMQRK